MKSTQSDYEGPLLDPEIIAQAIPETSSRLVPLAFLAVLLSFASLAFGAVHSWSYSLLQLALLGAAGLWLGRWAWALGREETASLTWVRTPLHPFIVCITVWVGLQLLPLPMWLVAWLSPQAAFIREMGAVPAPAWAPLSLNPFATRQGLWLFFSYVAVFFLTLAAIKRQKEITGAILFLGAVGAFQVIYGASQIFARPPRIWGWKNIYGGVRLNGTFINPDHLATWLAMAFFLVLGLFLALKPNSSRNGGVPSRDWAAWKRWLHDPRTMEIYIKRFLVLLLALVLASGLVMTQSRGGVWSGVVTLVSLFFLERARKRHQIPWAATLLFVGSLVLYISLVSGDVDLSRLGDPGGNEGRISMYLGTLAMARDFLLTGVGLGAFQDVFTIYQEPSLLNHFVNYPHSDWLQLLAEMGLPGFALVLAGYLVFVYYLWNQWRRRNDSFALGVGLGCLGALLCVGFHAAVEFPFHIPANTLMLAAVMALSVVAVHFHRRPWEHVSYRTTVLFESLSGRMALLVPLALAGLLLALATPVWHHWTAERLAPTQPDSTRRASNPDKEDIAAAMAKDPGNPAYYALMAKASEEEINTAQENGADPSQLQPLEETCQTLWEQAVRMNPANWRYRLELGSFLTGYEGQAPGDQLQRGLKELQAAVNLFPQAGYPRFVYGTALLEIKENFPRHLPTALENTAVPELQQAEARDPKLVPQVEALLAKYHLSREPRAEKEIQ